MELRSDILRLFTVVCVRATGFDAWEEYHVGGTENHAKALRKALDRFGVFVSRANEDHEDYDESIIEVLLIMEDTTRLGSSKVKLAFWPEETFANFYPGVKG